MKRRTLVDFIIAISSIIIGSMILALPIFHIINVKYVLISVLAYYGIINSIQFIFSYHYDDFDKLYVAIGSIISLLLLGFLNVEIIPSNIAIVLFVWIVINGLIRIKKCRFSNDENKKIVILKFISLILFILLGLLTVINLYYMTYSQIIIIGFYCFINGAIDLSIPITEYLINNK